MAYKIPVASVISNQFPEFVKEDYPRFVRFVELYYEYIKNTDLEGIGENFTSIRDIDATLDKFIDSLWKEFGINVPRTNIANDTHFLKHIKEFYSSKGSEESFRILFRHFFNTEIDIQYPQEYIFKPSDGEWIQDSSFVVDVTKGDIYDIVGQKISVITSQQKIPFEVKRVVPTQDKFEVFISITSYFHTLLLPGQELKFNGVEAKLVGSISTATISRTATGFYLGQIFSIPSVTGTGATLKVTELDSKGNLTNISILNYGQGYKHDFYASITATKKVAAVSEVTPILSPTLHSSTLGFVDKGFISLSSYWEDDYTSPTYCGEIIREFYTDSTTPVDSIGEDFNTAIIRIQIGAVRKYQGYYKSDRGFLSNSYKLQDSLYYQIYSYVISSAEALNTYRDIVKSLVHPTGMKLFGNQVLSNDFSLITTLEILNRFIQVAAQDSVYFSDTESCVVAKLLSEQLNTTSKHLFTINKNIQDTISLSDESSFRQSSSITENMAFSDAKEISLKKEITDTVSILGYTYWDAEYTSSDYVTSETAAVIEYADSTYNILLIN